MTEAKVVKRKRLNNEQVAPLKDKNEVIASVRTLARRDVMSQNNFHRHAYEDYGHVTERMFRKVTGTQSECRRQARGGVVTPFPMKLHEMLDAVEDEGLSSFVSWLPHGRALKVHDEDGFVALVLPQYFKQGKMASFRRQLNLYGFRRINSGSDSEAYFHELFLRGKPFLAEAMFRQKIKGGHKPERRGLKSGSTFYQMPKITNEDEESCDMYQDEMFRANDQVPHSPRGIIPFHNINLVNDITPKKASRWNKPKPHKKDLNLDQNTYSLASLATTNGQFLTVHETPIEDKHLQDETRLSESQSVTLNDLNFNADESSTFECNLEFDDSEFSELVLLEEIQETRGAEFLFTPMDSPDPSLVQVPVVLPPWRDYLDQHNL